MQGRKMKALFKIEIKSSGSPTSRRKLLLKHQHIHYGVVSEATPTTGEVVDNTGTLTNEIGPRSGL
jgi:hypothetical protein